MGQANYTSLFEGIQATGKLYDGKNVRLINFDNAATTPPFKVVNQTIKDWIEYYGPIGRGTGIKGDRCSDAYENSKEEVLDFFDVRDNPNYQVVYVRNTTEGLNLLSNIIEEDALILTTRMEHHSNDLPWRQHHKVIYVETDDKGRVKLEDIKFLFEYYGGKIKYLSITGASNVTGYINPIYSLAQLAHQHNAKIIVDGAQLVGHQEVKLCKNKQEYIDFIVFSGHKLYAPYGSGAVVGRFKELENNQLFMVGGGMVSKVFDNHFEPTIIPNCYEAGTPNFLGVMALTAGLKQLKEVGYSNIVNHENYLKAYLIKHLQEIESVILYGDVERTMDRIGVIPFAIRHKNCAEVAESLAYEYGIGTRFGKFCAYPYVDRLLKTRHLEEELPSYYGEQGLVRISFGLYNTKEEVDKCIRAIKQIGEEHKNS